MKIPVAVVGCGYWGPNLIRNFNEEDRVQVKYACDRMPARLEKIQKRYPAIICTTEYQEVLNDPEVQAIIIATPVHTHFPLALQALQANKHVLVEKPMCMTSDECRKLIAVAAERKLTLMVDHTFVYHGAIRRIKQVIDSGELGDILYFNSIRVNLGLFQSDINVVWDLACHDLSIMDYLLASTPTAIHAAGACHTGNGIDDIAYITMHMPNNVISNLQVSWLSPVKIRQILLGGTKKMIVYDDLVPMEKLRIYDKGISVEEPTTDQERYESLIQYRIGDMYAPVFDLTEALKVEVAHFVDCIVNKTQPLSDGEAGLRVVRMLELANASLKTGIPQPLEANDMQFAPPVSALSTAAIR
jgi:predicted dehydrogenase